jgi:hypothetical protein
MIVFLLFDCSRVLFVRLDATLGLDVALLRLEDALRLGRDERFTIIRDIEVDSNVSFNRITIFYINLSAVLLQGADDLSARRHDRLKLPSIKKKSIYQKHF